MSTALIALGLLACVAGFAAATSDAVAAVTERDLAATTAEQLVQRAAQSCAERHGCEVSQPPGCERCHVCRDDTTIVATVERSFNTRLLGHLSPARGTHVVRFDRLDPASFDGLPKC